MDGTTDLPQMYDPLLSPRNASIHAAILMFLTPWSPGLLKEHHRHPQH